MMLDRSLPIYQIYADSSSTRVAKPKRARTQGRPYVHPLVPQRMGYILTNQAAVLQPRHFRVFCCYFQSSSAANGFRKEHRLVICSTPRDSLYPDCTVFSHFATFHMSVLLPEILASATHANSLSCCYFRTYIHMNNRELSLRASDHVLLVRPSVWHLSHFSNRSSHTPNEQFLLGKA